jgi:hypothetical protein
VAEVSRSGEARQFTITFLTESVFDDTKSADVTGANVLVAGTSIFHTSDYTKAIRELRKT